MTIPQKGAAAAFLSYLWWGSMPLYWKALSSVSSSEILGHRVVWSAIFTFALIAVTGQWHKTTAFAVKNKRKTLWPVSYTHLDVYKRQRSRSSSCTFTMSVM